MNKCNLVRDLLPLYVDDALSEDSRTFVERHLKACPACAEEAEKLKAPVPEEAALASVQTKKEQKGSSIRRVSRKFKIRAAITAAVSAVLCGVIVFCCYFIPAEYDRKERLLEFNGWREYEGIRRSVHFNLYALSGYDDAYFEENITSLSNWTEQETAEPYLHGEENTGIQIKFRHNNIFIYRQDNPFSFSYGWGTVMTPSWTPNGTLTFTTSTIDVAEIVTRAKTPTLYEYVQDHPELYDPLEFAYYCYTYDFDAVTPWSSVHEILLTNDMRLLMEEESIWGPANPVDILGSYDHEGFPEYTDREVILFEIGGYRGYVLTHHLNGFSRVSQHIVISYGGYLWDIRFDTDDETLLPFCSNQLELAYFINNLEFIGLD